MAIVGTSKQLSVYKLAIYASHVVNNAAQIAQTIINRNYTLAANHIKCAFKGRGVGAI